MKQQVFSINLDNTKSNIIRKANEFKGLYGILTLKTGKRIFKFVSAREYKKDPKRVSLSFLVQNAPNSYNESDWQVVRVHQKKHGKIELGTYPVALQSFLGK